MRIFIQKTALYSLLWLFIGCQTALHQNYLGKNKEESQEALSALKSVAGSLSGKNLTDEEVKKIAQDMHKDPEAQSAVDSITQSVSQTTRIVKFCPVDGKRYSHRFDLCPEHQVPLKEVE